jgi:phenylalanyl-tRNA synthetase alpha chain
MSEAPDDVLQRTIAEATALAERAEVEFAGAANEQSLRELNARFTGKTGGVADLMKMLGRVEPKERKGLGQHINGAKQRIETAFAARLAALATEARNADLQAPPLDLSMPARRPIQRGHLHPISLIREEILDVFVSMGFVVADGPQVEREEYNFGKLGFPPDHPAMDMHDTFWVKPPPHAPDARALLRTHTSSTQVREMLSQKPPLAVVAAGPCYRCDEDATHSPMFHQMEGFLIDRNVSMAHLRGCLTEFIERLFGKRPVRLRASYFPFVEPGCEVDMQCPFCEGGGCRVCKQTGWVEILGAGMIHPVVFESCGLDPEVWSGFAFGTGIERPAMLKYGIPDLRLMFENDVRFLAQF